MASNLLSNLATAGSSALSASHHGHPRGRGTYVPQACSVCRHKKTKCDGKKPICGGCLASKRGDECSWGKDATPLRKNRNEAFFEALKKRNDALKEYCTYLETLLERCRREHGGLTDSVWLHRRPANDADLDSGDLIPFDDPDTNMHECSGSTDAVELEGDPGTDEGAIQGLIAPIQKLTLVCGSLMTYGSTAVYRFRPVVVNNIPSRFPKVIEDPRDTYILLVEGADQRCYNPAFDWNRYLPKDVPLTRVQHDKALDLMFKFCLSWCLRIIPTFFLRDMCRVLNAPKDQKPPQTAHYSPMLHNVLVALAVCLLDEPTLNDTKTKQRFVDEAKKYIDTECSQPNLSTVHALSTLGTFHSSQGDQTLGFMYFGMSARVSQALGLDVDCSEWVKSGLIEESDVLDRYWTFWTIFAQDVNWSLYVGRDFCVRGPTESDFKDMPIPFIDSEFDQMPFHHPPTNLPARPAYLSKNFASACELLVIARRIMAVVNGISKTRIKASVIDEMISDIDLQLNTWKDSLPPEVEITPKTRHLATPHQLMVHIAYWWFFILLHRPYFHRKPRVIHSSDKEIDHVKLCKRGADNIMDLTKTWHEIYGLRYCPLNIVQPLFAAGTIYLLSGIQAASGVRVAKKELKNSFDSLKLCIQHLREVGRSWKCAATVESILRGLIEERLKPAVEKRKAAAPRAHHGRSASEGGDASIYMANPPSSSRRPTSLRRSRAHNPGSSSTSMAQADSLVTSPLHSPTISVHPALDDFCSSRHPRHTSYGSQPMSANQELLSPWSAQSGSPGSQPIPIRNGGASSNGSSSSGSPVSVRMSASPTRNLSALSSSPTTPDLRHASPSGSFTNGTMAQSFSNDNSDPLLNLFTSFDAPVGGFGNGSGDQDQQPPTQFDMSSVEFSQYFAMLGGQPFSAMPFIGPIPNNNSESAVGIFDHQGHQQQQVRGGPLDLTDLDFSQFQPAGPEHLTGDPRSNGAFYPPFGGGGMPSNDSGGDFAFHQRRATSENFRTGADGDAQANGGELFTDFDFTATF